MIYRELSFFSRSDTERKAGDIFAEEIEKRCGNKPRFTEKADVVFSEEPDLGRDEYRIESESGSLIFRASGIRGFLYAVGMFLRKTEYRDGEIRLVTDITGSYSPYMAIRGHQLGWRTLSNTYEAWTPDDTYTYIKDLMFFGCNTFEHTVFDDVARKRNALMKQSEKDYIRECTEKAKTLDIDVSFWYPNDEKPLDESVKDRKAFFEDVPAADFYFPPGGDPGEYEADEFLHRTVEIAKAIRKIHPDVKIYPSAQSPHGFGHWGDVFIEEMEKLPEEIDGIITGPNCAMPLHELRRRLPLRYPIRLYPDITHNVRCEYPVHFDRDDWHYAWASTLSRESVNPRPTEYRTIHRLTRPYVIGSVSYSEGINDDINKMVWSALDYCPDADLTEILGDYARLFFPGADTQKAVNGIFGLEKNWEGDPAENPHIETTLRFFEEMASETPSLLENFRFLLCLFRAKCDRLVQMRRQTELLQIRQAKKRLACGDLDGAEAILKEPVSAEYRKLHDDIFAIGKTLFESCGIQLDTAHYFADGWERGAVLDTIDNPVTDRLWLLDRIDYARKLPETDRPRFLDSLLNRGVAKKGNYYFSFAENSFTELGEPQEPYFYMDFQGDRPNVNNGTIPMAMLKVYDHYSFRMKTGGLTGQNGYRLRLNLKPRYRDEVTAFTIKINGKILYQGKQYGGERDEVFEKELSAPGFECHLYDIPDGYIDNGCVELEITEPLVGVMLSEIFFEEKEN